MTASSRCDHGLDGKHIFLMNRFCHFCLISYTSRAAWKRNPHGDTRRVKYEGVCAYEVDIHYHELCSRLLLNQSPGSKEVLFTHVSVHLENEPIVDPEINLVLCVTVAVTGALQLGP